MKARKSGERGDRDLGNRPAARIIISAVLLLVASLPSFAQSAIPHTMSGLSFGGLFPTGGFNERVTRNGLEIGAFYGWRAHNTPLFYGAELSLSAYGHIVTSETLDSVPGVTLDIETFNSILQTLAFVRIQPRTGVAVTYLEALAGLSYLFTGTLIMGDADDLDDVITRTNMEDTTVAAGIGAGLSVRLGRPARHPGRAPFLDVKVRYMLGGRAEYLRQGSQAAGEDPYTLFPERSTTSFLTAQLGLTWFF
jgi:hypothetical protein